MKSLAEITKQGVEMKEEGPGVPSKYWWVRSCWAPLNTTLIEFLPSWRNQVIDGINVKSVPAQWTCLSKRPSVSLGLLQLHWPPTPGGRGFHKQTGLLDLGGDMLKKDSDSFHFCSVQSAHGKTPLPSIVPFLDNGRQNFRPLRTCLVI